MHKDHGVVPGVVLIFLLMTSVCCDEVRPRVVGGYREMNESIIRWQVLILRNGKVHCGGALLSRNKVLSAAHCNVDKRMRTHNVVIGHSSFTTAKRYEIVRVFKHELYHVGKHGEPIHDVAVIEFHNPNKTRLNFTYPTLNHDPTLPHPTDIVRVSGFGQTSAGGKTSDVLLSARLTIVPQRLCMGLYNNLPMTDRICAGSTTTDSCAGDSGGAMYDRQLHILGIVSFGKGCAHYRSPGIYVRCSSYVPWIEAVLREPNTPYFSKQVKILIGVITACGVALLIIAAVILACVLLRKIGNSGDDPKNAPWFASPRTTNK